MTEWVKQGNLTGPAGPAGPSTELAIGDVETLPYTEPAYVTISGTPPMQVLDFGIPQGLPGEGVAVDWADIANKPVTFPPTLPIAQSGVTNLVADLAAKAPLASPTFTGNPTAPTPTAGDNDTSVATTAFVTDAVSAIPNASDRVLRAGDTMTGILTISPPTGGAILYLDRPVGGNRYIETRVSGLPRWRIMLGNQNVESGSNAGTDFSLDRFTDAGGTLTPSAITINRSDGIVQMANGATTGSTTGLISYGSYSGTPISTLVGGTTAGGLIEAPGSGHLVIGIRNNDIGDSFSVVSYGVANVAPYDTLAFRVRADGTVFAGGQISSTAGVSAYSFGSPNTNGIFYATGAGTIFLRPNGAAVSTGQTTIDATGNMVVASNVTATGNFFSSTYFIGSANLAILGTNTGGTGQAIYLRPTAYNSAVGQMSVDATGDVIFGGDSIAFSSTVGIIGATGVGALYLRPNGVGSSVGQMFVASSGNVQIAAGLGTNGATPYARQALALPTGTIQRTTYVTSSVTLPQLAGVVMAMITDLRGMGFFS